MAWTKQFGGGTRMRTSYTFIVNGFCLKPFNNEEESVSWAEDLCKEISAPIINFTYKNNKILVITENGHFSMKITEKDSTEAEFEMSYDYPININLVLKNLEEKLFILDPCHILISKNLYFTIEKAEGLHLKNEAIVWIN
jgi:hypothetical protein